MIASTVLMLIRYYKRLFLSMFLRNTNILFIFKRRYKQKIHRKVDFLISDFHTIATDSAKYGSV